MCVAAFAASLSFCTVSLTGCGTVETGSDSSSASVVISVTLDKKTMTLSEWETGTLTAEISGTEESVQWRSGNEQIATVDQSGKIQALKQGETTITAFIGDVSDTCTLTVLASDVEPALVINEVDEESGLLIVSDVDPFNVNADVSWNGEKLSGASLSWISDDETIVTVNGSDGYSAVVVGKKEGSTTVRVSAEIRGKTAVTTFSVKVNSEGVLFKASNSDYTPFAGGYQAKIKAVEETSGDGMNTTLPEITAIYQKQPLADVTLDWTTEDDDIIELNRATGRITAKKAGTAVVTGSYYFDTLGKNYSVIINVEVQRVGVELEEKNVIINRSTTAPVITLSEETVESFVIDGKTYEDGFTLADGKMVLDAAKFDVADQRKPAEVKVVTDKREYTFSARTGYAIATLDEWKSIWSTASAPTVFAKASVIMIEADLDVSSWENGGNIVLDGSFTGIFDGQGHTIHGARATWRGLFNSVASEGVVRNVAFTGIKLLKEPKIFCNNVDGTIENCYFEGSTVRTDSDPTPALCKTLGRTAVLKNVVVNIHGSAANQTGQKAIFNYFGGGTGSPEIQGFYAVVDYSDGSASFETTVNENIKLYSSASALKNEVTALPEGFSSEYWQRYEGILSFKTSQNVIASYLASNALTIDPISGVEKESAVKLSANKDCTWSIEGLDASMYTLENGILTLNANATAGDTFTVVGTYTEELYGHTYTTKLENIEIKKKPAEIKELSETPLVGLNRTAAAYTFTLDNGDPVTGVTINNASVDGAHYTLNGTILTIGAAAFTSAGNANIKIETDGIVYTVTAEVVDYAIGTLDELKTLWNNGTLSGALKNNVNIVLTADIDATSYYPGAIVAAVEYNGTFDGRGYTIKGLQATYHGFFYTLGENGVIKNVAFTGIRLQNGGSMIFGSNLLGTLENCYFEGSGLTSGAAPALANQIGVNAVIKNVVIYVHDRPSGSEEKCGVFNNTVGWGTMANAPSGVYVINESSDGTVCYAGSIGSTDISGIHLYSSLEEFMAENTSRPDDISEAYWNILKGLTA